MPEIDLTKYNYYLPPKLLAKTPAVPRDSSRLLVYHTKTDKVAIDRFINLDKYLPNNSLLVLNDTKVIPARINLHKQTGGKVEVLLLINELRPRDRLIKGMVDRKINLGQKLFLNERHLLTAAQQDKNIFYFKPEFKNLSELTQILSRYGQTPIPKYLKSSTLAEKNLRVKYQSIFAKMGASVAAPTASLHFTKRVFSKLKTKSISQFFITLHVGLGTFAPISEKHIKNKKLHCEYYAIPRQTSQAIKNAKANKRFVVAVGTTTTRALESAADKIFTAKSDITGKTEIFIYPPYDFKIIDGLVTNFHLPQSSLMLLVEAFLQHKKSPKTIVDLYKIAVREKMRFYSFGDAMLVI